MNPPEQPHVFQDLLGPLSAKSFFETYWDKRPVILTPDSFPELMKLNPEIFLGWFATIGRSESRFLSYSGKTKTLRDGRRRLEELYAKHDEGNILTRLRELAHEDGFLVKGLSRQSPFTNWWMAAQKFWKCKVSLNGYLIAKGADHFPVHQDGHHIFALQSYGRKEWRFWKPSIRQPLGLYSFPSEAPPNSTPEVLTVNSGQILYIPTGWLHEAVTRSDYSIHLTFGLHPVRWSEILSAVIEQTAAKMELLRRPYPFKYSGDGVALDEFAVEELKALLELVADSSCESLPPVVEYFNKQFEARPEEELP